MWSPGDAVRLRCEPGDLVRRFRRSRRRSRQLFDLVADEAYHASPIPLRHPVVFYEGHIPAFHVNVLLKRTLGLQGIDPELEALFARGIDPEDEAAAAAHGRSSWPARKEVAAYVEAADRAVAEALERLDPLGPTRSGIAPQLGACTVLEHEAMHQETLLYMLHRLPYAWKRRPAGAEPRVQGRRPERERVAVPAGRARLGADPTRQPFGWDNEFSAHTVEVPAFGIDRHDVTNGDYLEFVEAGGYSSPEPWTPGAWRWRVEAGLEHPSFWVRREGRWLWRGMFEEVPLPEAWPVYVTHAEASAYARWKGGRLPTEAEYHRAAFGSPSGEERPFPWGDEAPGSGHGNFNFGSWDPEPAGTRPEGQSAWGVHDLMGNGWEWTSSLFAPFPGFHPMATYPEYSADFFDGQHYVMKGASPATAPELLRGSLRNWFRPHYPYVYATFRCVG